MQNPQELEKVKSALLSAKKAICIDTETNYTSFHDLRYCMGISLCIDDECWYIPTHHDDFGKGEIVTTDITGLFDTFSNVPIIFHNAKFDLPVLRKLGITIPEEQIYDTMIMAHLIHEEMLSFELDDLAREYLGVRKDVALAAAMRKFTWEHVPAYIMAKYAEQDARVTYNLFWCLKNKFSEFEDVWKIDREFMFLLMEMEEKGICLDVDKVKPEQARVQGWVDNYKKELGFDPGKRKLLHEYVFGTLGLKPLTFTPGGLPQVNTNFLIKTDHPFCKSFRKFKQQEKLLTSYLNPYIRLAYNGRFHANYKQHGTVTGRLSCSDPNMQQIPRDSPIKGFFQPEEGCELWEIDYRTLEFRLAAVYAKQKNLLDVFAVDGDMHQLTANLLGIDRPQAKNVNFAMIYGSGAEGLARQFNISLDQAKSILSDWRKSYSNIYKKSLEAAEACEANMGKIKMWSGRYRHFRRSYDFHKAWNAIIQGGGFEIVKVSCLKLRQEQYDIRNQVHDSVWLNLNPSISPILQQLERAERIMSDWTEEMFGLKFSVESKRLA